MPRWQYQIKAEPIYVPSTDWYMQSIEPVRIRIRPEGVISQPIEWLFWGWYEQLPEPTREKLYNYLVRAMAEAPFRQLFMQPRDYLGY